EARIGMHSSSRNSEVIHAGIYYPEHSLKARLCVRGRQLLYHYCADRNVDHQRIGKLIVATRKNELDKLRKIQQQGLKNGVDDLRMMSADEIGEIEPNVECVSALLSPSTGIVDSHTLMLAMQADIEAHGNEVVLNSEVTNLKLEGQGLRFECGGEVFACKTLVNSAGLGAVQLVLSGNRPRGGLLQNAEGSIPVGARHAGDFPGLLQQYLAKGHYFAYRGKSPFKHLIYPLPIDGGLGIHATNDLAGITRFGPDVIWIDEVDYDFDENRKPEFVAAIRRYYPGLDESKLSPDYTGVRPKLHGPGKPAPDFVIQGAADHGVRGLVNLIGIESPGLTSCLAIGEYVSGLLQPTGFCTG
ncbi:MAG: NAD(P)/FAD-dependent oxidoreductase, partial [Proteobacteria bacterium]|nr:NAD(P)/FAD-dependent oxidoreductase [Pseudomonadota bacterium]